MTFALGSLACIFLFVFGTPQMLNMLPARVFPFMTDYQLSAVPPGEYLITAIEDVEQGEWFDPGFLDEIKGRATKIRIEEGDQRTQDLKVSPM